MVNPIGNLVNGGIEDITSAYDGKDSLLECNKADIDWIDLSCGGYWNWESDSRNIRWCWNDLEFERGSGIALGLHSCYFESVEEDAVMDLLAGVAVPSEW